MGPLQQIEVMYTCEAASYLAVIFERFTAAGGENCHIK